MIYRFQEFELDLDTCELRRDGKLVGIEPQVFALLHLLVENHDRLVTKDEIIEKIWDGRFISEAAISSRIRAVRKALGDDSKKQRYLRTHYKRGLRFQIKPTLLSRSRVLSEKGQQTDAEPVLTTLKPSIAVLPFTALNELCELKSISDAFPHDLIVALSRLRWLSVVARGSSFKFRGDDQDIIEIGKVLGVSYCLSGSVEMIGPRLSINVELASATSGKLVWAERFVADVQNIFDLREQIIARCLVELELNISKNEARSAHSAEPTTLDTWTNFHTGLQLYYHFNDADNQKAINLFEHASRIDSTFCRAHAALSSAYFQKAFYKYDGKRTKNILPCREAAMRAFELDPLDPFACYAMGRVFWLTQDVKESAEWFEQATSLSPSYSHGHYAYSWAQIVLGRSSDALDRAEEAMKLSPLDPFLASMQWIKACALMDMEKLEEAVLWSERAARSPRSTIVMPLLALVANQAAENRPGAEFWARRLRDRSPSINKDDIFQMMPFQNPNLRHLFQHNLERLGF
ncbi:Adenylate cyclase [Candidatus Rhodobacter oscarellae]|uniref:Adenylate cyclase n=1 Tax=Candidatus Rhodobacter oscarellae TaxID=1675527 RepID=A0A0J9EA53_9RHOB|nr:winged helix-turn-helix domain-containing protein [Candidatus Rhodobacter lobularis]KMW59657.1 Adenylate cyclase [Candidatus Rhodobacter lobularis]